MVDKRRPVCYNLDSSGDSFILDLWAPIPAAREAAWLNFKEHWLSYTTTDKEESMKDLSGYDMRRRAQDDTVRTRNEEARAEVIYPRSILFHALRIQQSRVDEKIEG